MADPHTSYQCVIFDVDGTLLDTRTGMLIAINALLRELGRAPVNGDALAGAMHRGLPAMLRTALDETGLLPPPETLAQWERAVRQRYLDEAERYIRPFAGVGELLQTLHEVGTWMAVCSNQEQAVVEALLRGLDLRHHFREIVGGDTFATRKPDPAALNWLMLCARSAPSQTLMVGDSELDAECAARAQVDAVLLRHGYGDGASRFAHTPLDDIAALRRYLRLPPP